MSTAPISKILAPVDLSSCSRAALEFACKLARPFGASIDVLFVRSPTAVTPTGEAGASKEELAAAHAELHRFVTTIPGAQATPITEHVEAGNPEQVIIQTAEKGGFDAIV